MAPTLPKDKDFDILLSMLKRHYDPKPLVIAECFRFYKRIQSPNKSLANFLADLRRLSIRCEFKDFLEEALRDIFVCGVRSEQIQKKLLTEDGLTVARALEISQGMEVADKNAEELHDPGLVKTETLHFSGQTKTRKPCYRCGCQHNEKDCKFREAICNHCGKQGHIVPVCKSKSQQAMPPSGYHSFAGRKNKRRKPRKPAGGTKWIGTGENSDESNDSVAASTFVIRDSQLSKPIMLTVCINGKSVDMKLDTG